MIYASYLYNHAFNAINDAKTIDELKTAILDVLKKYADAIEEVQSQDRKQPR